MTSRPLWPLLFTVFPAFCGNNYFVSPSGNSAGDGSSARPWALADAISRSSIVAPGDTIWLRGGDYSSPNGFLFYCNAQGSAGAPVTIRPAPGERAVLLAGFYIQKPWIIVRDLELASPYLNRVTSTPGSFPPDVLLADGITSFAPNVKIINNIVHDLGSGINSWVAASDNEIYGNIIYNNGHLGPDRGHGHGMYMQNSGPPKYISDNVVFNQFGLGMQLYGTSSTTLDNFVVEGNIVFNNGNAAGHESRNILLGGSAIANNPVVRNNYTYYNTSDPIDGDNNFGYYDSGAGCKNLILESNYFVSGAFAMTMHKCTVSSLRNNIFYGDLRNWSASSFPANVYLGHTRPASTAVFVRPNKFEAGRAHVVVFNWGRSDSLSIDLSGIGLASGDEFEIRDVQNLWGSPVLQAVYSGAPVSIPQNLTVVVQPNGNSPIFLSHTDREFNVYLVRKTSPNSAKSPFAISGLSVDSIDQNSAVVTWSTSAPGDQQVFFGLTASYGQSTQIVAASSTSHSVILSGLLPDTAYFLRAVSSTGTESASGSATFRTLSNALTISGARVASITDNSAVVAWNTSRSANDQVLYGASAQYGLQTPISQSISVSHTVSLKNLTPDTGYTLKLISAEQGGAVATQTGLSFRTLPAAISIANATVSQLTTNSAVITWTTNVPAVDVVTYGSTQSFRSGSIAGAAFSNSHSALIGGLMPNSKYYVRLQSTDQASRVAVLDTLSFSTPNLPLQIIAASAFGIGNTQATIDWQTSRDTNMRVSWGATPQYGSVVALPAFRPSSYTFLSGLKPGTLYYVELLATDATGDSAVRTLSFRTTGAAPAGLQLSNLQATSITGTSALIVWSTNLPASDSVLYGTSPGLGSTTPLNATKSTYHSVALTNLSPGTAYYFQATGADSTGGAVTSPVLTFTTPTLGVSGPPVVQSGYSLAATPAAIQAGGMVVLHWAAPSQRSPDDWIGLYLMTATNREYRWYSLARGSDNGSITVTLPAAPGEYEFRFLTHNSYTDVARSNTITVR